MISVCNLEARKQIIQRAKRNWTSGEHVLEQNGRKEGLQCFWMFCTHKPHTTKAAHTEGADWTLVKLWKQQSIARKWSEKSEVT